MRFNDAQRAIVAAESDGVGGDARLSANNVLRGDFPDDIAVAGVKRIKSAIGAADIKPILAGGGAFPVRRGEADLEAIRRAVELVRDGEIVVMFPEGTRRRKGLRKKHEARAHTGAARIALAAGAPLVPAAIKGTDRLSRLAPLRVAYGRPIPLDDLRGQELSPAAREATDRLMADIRELEASL